MTNVNNWKLMQYIVRDIEDDPSTKLVLISLASYVRANWTSSVALSTLVKETGLSRNTVRKVLKQLEVDKRIYKLAGGRQNLSSTFVIVEPPGFAEWASQMFGRKESQRVNHEPQRVKSALSEGQSLPPRRNKKIEEERTDKNLTPEQAITGRARRDAVTAARLIMRSQKQN